MIIDLVKQAVRIKMTCKSESPLLSGAEYCYACACALREMGSTEEEVKRIGEWQKIEEIREHYVPEFEKVQGRYREDPKMFRLLHLLTSSRLTGEITDEMRKILT